jgi:hypothetical protein
VGWDGLVLADNSVPIVRPELCEGQVAHGPPQRVPRRRHHGAAQDIELRPCLARQRNERVRVPVVPYHDLPVLGDAQVQLNRVRALDLDGRAHRTPVCSRLPPHKPPDGL